MPSPTPEFHVDDTVICIHPKSEYHGKVGTVTSVHTDTHPDIRYGVLWNGESESMTYRQTSLGTPPRAINRVPVSHSRVRREGNWHRKTVFEMQPTPRRDAALRARRPAPTASDPL